MAITEELIAKFKADITDFDRKINKVKSQIDQTGRKTDTLERKTARTASLMASHYKAIGISVGLAGGAIGAFAIKVGSDMQQAQKRIEAMLGSAKDAEKVIKTLRQAGQETGASVIGLANSYGKLATFVDNGTLSLRESLKISKGLSSTALALGAGTEQLNQVMFGLSQALGSGTVRAEEFNQVTEPLPGIINRMEESAGLASGELRRMINDGKVTSEMFKDLLIPAVESFSVEAGKMASTLKAQQGILANTLSAIGEDIFDHLESPLSSATESLNDFLQTFLSVKRASNEEVQSRLNEVISRQTSFSAIDRALTKKGRPDQGIRDELAKLDVQANNLIAELDSRTNFSTQENKKSKKQTSKSLTRNSVNISNIKNSSVTSKVSANSGITQSNFNTSGLSLVGSYKQEIEGLKSITLEVENQSKSVADIMEGAFGDATSAIEQNFIAMATGSSGSFKDMARSMINDLNRIILRSLAMQAISGLVNQAGSAFGFGMSSHNATVGNTYGVTGGAGGLQYGLSGLAGARANGGGVGAGMSYLVGERGPEILTMGSKGGFVTSNAQSGSMLNNSSQTINIDARGASAGVEQKIRQVVSDVINLKKQVPNIAISAVREQNARKPDFLR